MELVDLVTDLNLRPDKNLLKCRSLQVQQVLGFPVHCVLSARTVLCLAGCCLSPWIVFFSFCSLGLPTLTGAAVLSVYDKPTSTSIFKTHLTSFLWSLHLVIADLLPIELSRHGRILMDRCHSSAVHYIAVGVKFALLWKEFLQKKNPGNLATSRISFCIAYHRD